MATEQNSTHTPWRCAGCGKAADGLIKTCNCPTMVGRRDDAAGRPESTWLVTREQDEKNRLTAAAPDMLVALAPFAAVAEHDIGQDEADADLFQVMSEKNARAPRLTVGHLRAALAAISKAEGRL